MLALPPDEGGVSMAAAVWTLAILGILIEFFWVGRPKWLIGLTYVLLGWGLMFKGPAIYAAIGLPGLSLLIIGGALCSLGVIFYVQKSKEFMHAVFHLFVLVSIVPTWASIYGYVLG